ncbi:MAG: methyltransferase [Gracilimonas sp.]|nr:methyltransferase [Gracilimonas sp.]
MDTFNFKDNTYSFSRYPETTNRSLRAWSAADEYLIDKLFEDDTISETTHLGVYNDRFGFLSCILNRHEPTVILERKSQQRCIIQNLEANGLDPKQFKFSKPLDQPKHNYDRVLLNIPKSMDLFELYLHQLHANLADDGTVLCGFMTKYFTPQILSIAETYFENVEQSLARKKSRVLVLKGKKESVSKSLVHRLDYDFGGKTENIIEQNYGVFSSDHIDYATQFLIDHIQVKESENKVLDLACGNGVLAMAVQLQKPEAEIFLTDDSFLAIESAKLNIDGPGVHYFWNDRLDDILDKSLDLVVTNPPFHFGFETNIEVTIRLFNEVAEKLKETGRLVCVANQHLNYKTHLEKIFKVNV